MQILNTHITDNVIDKIHKITTYDVYYIIIFFSLCFIAIQIEKSFCCMLKICPDTFLYDNIFCKLFSMWYIVTNLTPLRRNYFFSCIFCILKFIKLCYNKNTFWNIKIKWCISASESLIIFSYLTLVVTIYWITLRQHFLIIFDQFWIRR